MNMFRLLLTGQQAQPAQADPYYKGSQVFEVIAGNLFDGDMGYNMVGFVDNISVSFQVNTKIEHSRLKWKCISTS